MRLKGWAPALAMLVVMASCQNRTMPDGILSRPQMVNWMVQIYVAEAKIDNLRVLPDSAYRLFLPMQDSLMRVQSLQDSVLKKSYRYYLERPDEMEKIYDAVIDSLSLYEQRIRQKPPTKRPQ